MNKLKEKMTQFIKEQGAVEDIRKFIVDSIEEYKKKPAYEYIPPENKIQKFTLDPSKDKAGEIREIKGKTIGDIARNEEDIFRSYTGDGWTSWSMHRGYKFPKVNDVILKEINLFLYDLKFDFISENGQDVVDYFKKDINKFLNNDAFSEDEKVDFSLPLDDDAIETLMIFMDSDREFSYFDIDFIENELLEYYEYFLDIDEYDLDDDDYGYVEGHYYED